MAPPSLPRPSGRPTGGPRPSPADRPHGASLLPAVPQQVPPGSRFPVLPPGSAGASRPPRDTHRAETFDLPATPASVALARRTVRALLEAWGVDEDTGDSAVLVVSELVTNVLTHTGSERFVCRLSWTGVRLRVEIEDEDRGGTRPLRRQPGDDDQNGRGLLLVGALSRDWGVRDTACGSGRVVWSELAPEGAESGPEAPARAAAPSRAQLPSPAPVPALCPAPPPAVALPVRTAELPSREVALRSGADRPPPWGTAPPETAVRP